MIGAQVKAKSQAIAWLFAFQFASTESKGRRMQHPPNIVSSVTRFCFVRHGETAWNIERRLQGQLDIDLNPLGRHQAQAVAAWLAAEPIDALYASDLKRAWHTAERLELDLGLPRRALPELRERRYGVFEGLTYEEAAARYPDAYRRLEAREPEFVLPEGGESLVELSARVSAALCALAEAHHGQTVVAVTHGGVLDVINRFVRGRPLAAPRDFVIPNAGLNWVTVQGGRWDIEAWGHTEHLQEGALDELR